MSHTIPLLDTMRRSLEGPVMRQLPADAHETFYTVLREYFLDDGHFNAEWSTEFAELLTAYCVGRQFPQHRTDHAFCIYARRVYHATSSEERRELFREIRALLLDTQVTVRRERYNFSRGLHGLPPILSEVGMMAPPPPVLMRQHRVNSHEQEAIVVGMCDLCLFECTDDAAPICGYCVLSRLLTTKIS